MMQVKAERLFLDPGAIVFLTAATALVVSNLAPAYLGYPHDPVFMVSIRALFWIGAGAFLLVSLACLFGKESKLWILCVTWVATNLGVYWLGLLWCGGGNLSGYFATFPDAFGVSARAVSIAAELAVGYLLLGGWFCLIWLWRRERLDKAAASRKMTCPACGGHIQFAWQNAGRHVACPHCRAAIVLLADDTLKMTCVLCGGHLEFPAYALNRKIKCPHCMGDITLKAPA
jgi:DNA-directed RNA polymerase subunit RPC12/RpoP